MRALTLLLSSALCCLSSIVCFAQPYPIDREGYIHAPAKAGLGVDWDRQFFTKYNLEWT